MGDQGTPLDALSARHLMRRTGFGWSPSLVARWVDRGYTRGRAADELVNFRPGGFRPGGSDRRAQHNAYVKYLIRAKSGLNEKLTLFWGDHFATAIAKVSDVKRMGLQNQFLRRNCRGSMVDLVKGINRDPAMMDFLDTIRNSKWEPNENYSREMLELFTIGVLDLDGRRNYSDQQDPFQGARAFTGWRFDYRTSAVEFRSDRHDFSQKYPDRGPKVLFAADDANPAGYGGFGPAGASYVDGGEGEAEIDELTDVVFRHRDTAGHRTVARRTARRLFEFFAYGSWRDADGTTHGGFSDPEPDSTERQAIDDVLAASGFEANWDIGRLVREIVVHDAFYASLSEPAKKSVKWPIDFVVTTLKILGVKPVGRYAEIAGRDTRSLYTHLQAMGMTLLDPPSVFGWDWETAWISSQTLLARLGFARDVYSSRETGGMRPDRLVDLTLTDPGDIVDAVTALLGVKEDLLPAERSALVAYLGAAPVNLSDFTTLDKKLRGLIGLVAQSPAYQLH